MARSASPCAEQATHDDSVELTALAAVEAPSDVPLAADAGGFASSWTTLRDALARSLPEEVVAAACKPAGWSTACEEMAAGLPRLVESFPESFRDWLLPRVRIEAEAILHEATRLRMSRLSAMWQDLPTSDRQAWERKAARALDEYHDLLHEWRSQRLQAEPRRPLSAYFMWVRSMTL